MQNIFFKVGGKHSSDHVTIYQNRHVLVLFKNPLDNTVIMGDLKTSPKLKYRTDIFATDPIPHQTIYHLEK